MSHAERRARALGSHQSARSETNDWLTPPHILAAMGGADSFDLDPCSVIDRPWPTARQHLTIHDNGLRRRWHGRVWLNPPYSSSVIGAWLGRMAEHGRGVALIFARTETEAFFRGVWDHASALLFIRGRLHFHFGQRFTDKHGRTWEIGERAEANGGAPSVLCAYGGRDAEVLADCGIAGQFVPLRLPRALAAVFVATWSEVLSAWVRAQKGPVRLDDIYREFARHPKAAGNRHVAAKIRQTLQRGPFRRVAPGIWEAAQ